MGGGAQAVPPGGHVSHVPTQDGQSAHRAGGRMAMSVGDVACTSRPTEASPGGVTAMPDLQSETAGTAL